MTEPGPNGISRIPPHLEQLLRHFAGLRDGTHGDGAISRADKERCFAEAVDLLDPPARQVLAEMNEVLLLGTGTIGANGLVRQFNGDLLATWSLGWPEQRQAGLEPVSLQAVYGRGFHHPHLRGATLGFWPLNVFTSADAAEARPTLQAIAAAELHNLVLQSDFRIIPAIVQGWRQA